MTMDRLEMVEASLQSYLATRRLVLEHEIARLTERATALGDQLSEVVGMLNAAEARLAEILGVEDLVEHAADSLDQPAPGRRHLRQEFLDLVDARPEDGITLDIAAELLSCRRRSLETASARLSRQGKIHESDDGVWRQGPGPVRRGQVEISLPKREHAA
jgi:hypothetical protein